MRIWLNTAQAADHSGYGTETVRRAAEAGLLHGTQRTTGGRWRFHVGCVDAWVLKEPCVHARKKAS